MNIWSLWQGASSLYTNALHWCSGLYISQFIHPGGCRGAHSSSSCETACKVLFPFACTLPWHELRTKYHKSATAFPGLSPSCSDLHLPCRRKGLLDPQLKLLLSLSSGLSLPFKSLASADDTVLIFPYHDSLPACLFILIIISKGLRLGKIISREHS